MGHGDRYIGSLFRVDEPVPDDSEDLGDFDLTGIQWMIVGGESGPNARPMLEPWVLNLRQLAKRHRVSFFFKQWGTWGRDGVKRSKHANGKKLEGKVVQQMPR